MADKIETMRADCGCEFATVFGRPAGCAPDGDRWQRVGDNQYVRMCASCTGKLLRMLFPQK